MMRKVDVAENSGGGESDCDYRRCKCQQTRRRDGEQTMTFEEVWESVKGLPNTAMKQVPGSLSDSTKKRLARLKPDEVSKIVLAAIEEVNHGSIEPLDKLIQKRL